MGCRRKKPVFPVNCIGERVCKRTYIRDAMDALLYSVSGTPAIVKRWGGCRKMKSKSAIEDRQRQTEMGPGKIAASCWLLAATLLLSGCAASSADKDVATQVAATNKAAPKDGPEARVELDDDEDFEAGEYVVPKTVLECMILADWACVQVKTVRAIRLWLNIGTNVVQSKPVSQVILCFNCNIEIWLIFTYKSISKTLSWSQPYIEK